MRYQIRVLAALFVNISLLTASASAAVWEPRPQDYFTITVVDEETGRGVPLVELSHTNGVRFYTDSNGVVAINEPGMLNQRVHFDISSHGYEYPGRDFFGRGETLDLVPGKGVTLKIRRRNIAERLYRQTGEGIYRDSVLVGLPVPTRNPVINGLVTGQDTVSTSLYRGKIYWAWGDTGGLAGMNLSASGATSELPGQGGLDPNDGVNLEYFVNEDGFSKPMCPYESPGLKWIEGLFTLRDDDGRERLMARCTTVRGLGPAVEWHIIMFNDEVGHFDSVARWTDYPWGHRSAHPFHALVDGEDYVYIFPFLRVKADFEAVKDSSAYEVFTPLAPGTLFKGAETQLERDADGRLVYDWKPDTDPLDEHRQRELEEAGVIQPGEGWYLLTNIADGQRIGFVRTGSVCWNDFAQRYVMISEGIGGAIFYAESDTPIGPWVYARQIVEHDRYSFYNPTQHVLFDQDGGRRIYFEATYTEAFSDAPFKTPHYDYNQIMYRLSLDDPDLLLPVPVYRVEDQAGAVRHLTREAVAAEGLWEQVRDIPFFALPPRRNPPQTVAVGVREGDKGTVLSVLESETEEPLFRALPAGLKEEKKRFTGRWEGHSRTDTGMDIPWSFDLREEGSILFMSGRDGDEGITSGTLTEGEAKVRVQRSGFNVDLTFHIEDDGALRGTWELVGGGMNGTMEGQRKDALTPESFTRLQASSSATADLYEYRREDGARIYSTNAELQDAGLTRADRPICRVWVNPQTRPILDWKPQWVPPLAQAD